MSKNRAPQPWEKADPTLLRNLRGICLDIDDTLSTHGKLTAEAYHSLWKLKAAGLAVVPVTGRPAGWCDHFARFWPVHAVVGENGAFTFFMQNGIRKRIDTLQNSENQKTLKQKLLHLGEAIQQKFPHARWASDQGYREYDLAIDVCEDVEPWKPEAVKQLLEFCKSQGAHAKLSSIHVNTWFGDYDKHRGFQTWLDQGAPGWPETTQAPTHDQWIYVGDSPNDEPMFKAFPYSVGVANLTCYLPTLVHPPTWLTRSESGAGFSEVAERLIHFLSL